MYFIVTEDNSGRGANQPLRIQIPVGPHIPVIVISALSKVLLSTSCNFVYQNSKDTTTLLQEHIPEHLYNEPHYYFILIFNIACQPLAGPSKLGAEIEVGQIETSAQVSLKVPPSLIHDCHLHRQKWDYTNSADSSINIMSCFFHQTYHTPLLHSLRYHQNH